jgi:hypothetical protein
LQVDHDNPPGTPARLWGSHGGPYATDPDNLRLLTEARSTFTVYVRDRDSTSAKRQKVKTRFAWWVDGERLGDVDTAIGSPRSVVI